MVAANDPTKPFLDATQRYQARLMDLWKKIFKQIATKTRALIRFGDKVLSKGKEIAGKVGEAVVKRIAKAYLAVKNLLKIIPNILKTILRLGDKIITLIKKAADPNKIIGTLKKLFARYARMFREIFDKIQDFFGQLEILEKALAVVNSFKTVLRLMVAWVAEVSGAYDGVRKAKTILKKVITLMKKEVKESIKLRKDVAKLKVAA